MESEIPKQFLHVAGKPVLIHTISRFYDYSQDLSIRVVLPEPYIDFWQSLCKRFEFTLDHTILEGGKSRFYSVRNGLKDIEKDSLVAIHDGVRPLVGMNTIHQGFKTAEKKGNAIPVVKMNESIRQLKNGDSIPANRKKFRIIQTPQFFQSDIVKSAYEQKYQDEFTDDATVVEALGHKINLFDGNYENIKITRPVDLKIAETFLK